MKAIRTNKAVELTSGITVAPGAVFSIAKAQIFRPVAGLVPIHITPAFHCNIEAMEAGLEAIDVANIVALKGRQFVFRVPVDDYESRTAEDLFLDSMFILLRSAMPADYTMVNSPDARPAPIALSASDVIDLPGAPVSAPAAESKKTPLLRRIFG
jgi:hypothetical protein